MSKKSGPRWQWGALFWWLLPGLALGALGALIGARCLQGDALGYYAWLHSLVHDGDLDLANQYALLHPLISYQLFPVIETGRIGNAFAFGSALLWAPWYATLLYLERNGWLPNPPLCPPEAAASGIGGAGALAVALGSGAMALAAAYLALDLARRRAPLGVASMSALVVALGTPLLYYGAVEPGMSHAPGALIVTLVFWLLLRHDPTLQGERPWAWLAAGAALGLVGLVRWQLLLIGPPLALIPLLRRRWQALGAFALGALALLWPLPLVWWRTFGKPLVLPAIHQHPFTFLVGPRYLPQTWFAGRHGLFVWSPLVALCLAGMVLSWRRSRHLAAVALASFAFQALLNASVNDWWGGAAFGARRMVELYPLYVLGLTEWFQFPQGKMERALAWACVGLAVGWCLMLLLVYRSGRLDHEFGTAAQALNVLRQKGPVLLHEALRRFRP